MYIKYTSNPSSVSQEWQDFFASNEAKESLPSWKSHSNSIIEATPETKLAQIPHFDKSPDKSQDKSPGQTLGKSQYDNSEEVLKARGHLAAKLDPLGLDAPKTLLDLGINPQNPKLPIYTSSIGVEFSHMTNQIEQEWLYKRHEELWNLQLSKEAKLSILKDLIEVDGFEQYIHKKFPGAKRFSIEGGDASIVATRYAIEIAAENDAENVVIGMAHRGRLNTLAKILGKPYEAILGEFMGIYSMPSSLGLAGDVKYHMGYSNDVTLSSGKKIHQSLVPNPSHLESVNPVVAGSTRAKQDLSLGADGAKSPAPQSISILIHGDAAFCGQGVVAESIAMSPLDAFDVGGIFHMIINNQVGFTANPRDGHKSSRYSSDMAKIIGAPIIHVNGDDVEAVVKATMLLSEYRARYKKDAFLEIICYRKYGHNEGDEPMYTQPLMYSIIKGKAIPAKIYQAKLVSEGVSTDAIYNGYESSFHASLDEAYAKAKDYTPPSVDFTGIWRDYTRYETDKDKALVTGVKASELQNLLEKANQTPSSFNINSKLKKLFDQRIADFTGKSTLDWATCEQLAFASMLNESRSIRLVGQDAGRGTFSHRHSVLHDQKDGSKYIPLQQIARDGARYEVYDSNLSEYAVLGFELGYSMSNPKALVIWEAQFGDFANGAQIIFDQYLSSMETKWLRLSGLVLLLPHSFEGQGPEHSSARVERYLQLCAEDNMQITYPTTPANIFHLLRRQVLRSVRKPLIILSPKSIFRNSLALSKVEDISENTRFKEVVEDNLDPAGISKVILCSGKIYYDLLDARNKSGKNNVALIRLEQLYPFPLESINKELTKYKDTDVIWCQEEPENMGAWYFIYSRFASKLSCAKISCISRKEAASPATGYASHHTQEQQEIINKALDL